MEYKELKKLFSDHESSCPDFHLTGYITFSSFGPAEKRDFPWEGRTYSISSDNKAFQGDKGGYSIFGNCLDGTDCCVRLEHYMAEEHGGKSGWVVEDCCVVGYLLIESADMSISTPQMFYSASEARNKMLSLIVFVNEKVEQKGSKKLSTISTKEYKDTGQPEFFRRAQMHKIWSPFSAM